MAITGVLTLVAGDAAPRAEKELGFSFENVAASAGLTTPTVYGGKGSNTFLIETTGTGVAVIDYDGDGWMDVFLVNGTTLDGFTAGQRANESPLSQPRQRHLRGRDRGRRPGARRLGAGGVRRATTTTTATKTCS